MAIFELLDRIERLPKGVANGVVGAGDVVGEALASDPRVDKISFTGSSEIGRRLMELGSKTGKLLGGGRRQSSSFPTQYREVDGCVMVRISAPGSHARPVRGSARAVDQGPIPRGLVEQAQALRGMPLDDGLG
jgi:hypothetical protein